MTDIPEIVHGRIIAKASVAHQATLRIKADDGMEWCIVVYESDPNSGHPITIKVDDEIRVDRFVHIRPKGCTKYYQVIMVKGMYEQ